MVLGVIGPTNCSTLAAVLRAFTAHTTCAVPMTTSHAPATIARTTIELIGGAITTTPATALSTPAKMCQPRSGNSLRCAHQPEGGPRITALDSRDVLGGLGEVVENMPFGDRPGDLGYPRPGDHVQKLTSIKCSRVGRVRLGHLSSVGLLFPVASLRAAGL
jgi:hypothetical protein